MYVGVSLVANSTPFRNWLINTHASLEAENQSRLSLALGPRGSRKSWSSVSLGDILRGDKFKIKRDVVFFDSWRFMDRIQTARKSQFLVLDDFGKGLDSRQFGRTANILVSQYLETSRPKNLWLYLSTPHKILVDVRVRILADDQLMFDKVPKKVPYGVCHWFLPKPDRYGKHTDPFLSQLKINNIIIDPVRISCPPMDKAEKYEELRSAAVDRQTEEIREFMEGRAHLLNLAQVKVALRLSSEDILRMASLDLLKLWREGQVPKVTLSEVEKLQNGLDLRSRDRVVLLNPRSTKIFPGRAVELKGGWSLGVF